MTAPYDEAALWNKAKMFLNRAMDNVPERSSDEEALWAAAALELLGKAASHESRRYSLHRHLRKA